MISGKPLLTAEQIGKKVRDLAGKISSDYAGKEIIAVGVLRGCFMFFADLVRTLRIPVIVDFIAAASYASTETTGKVNVYADLREDVSGRHVLLIDDIIDTGISLHHLRKHILERNPASLRICVLLDKEERRQEDVPVDYRGFVIPDKFVVGYGLDHENSYRNLPYIAVFKGNK